MSEENKERRVQLSFQEVQTKYYSEGPEAARTTEYVETTRVVQIIGKKEEPRRKRSSRRIKRCSGDFIPKFDLRTYSEMGKAYDSSPEGQAKLMSHKFQMVTDFLQEYDNAGGTRPPYWSSEDEDEEDFRMRINDYANVTECQKSLMLFYKRNKHFMQTLISFFKTCVFITMVGIVLFSVISYEDDLSEQEMEEYSESLDRDDDLDLPIQI